MTREKKTEIYTGIEDTCKKGAFLCTTIGLVFFLFGGTASIFHDISDRREFKKNNQ